MSAQQQNRVSEKEKFTVTNNVVSFQASTGRHQALFDVLVKIAESPLLKLWDLMGMLGQAVDAKAAEIVYLQENVADWVFQAKDHEAWNAREAAVAHSSEDLPEPLFNMMQGMHPNQVEILKELTLRMNPTVDITPMECYQNKASALFKRELLKLLASMSREDVIKTVTEIGNVDVLEELLALQVLIGDLKDFTLAI